MIPPTEHCSETCTSGEDGGRCDMCAWAEEVKHFRLNEQAAQPDSPALRRTRSIIHHWEMVEDQMRVERDFESEWSTASSTLTHYVEREIAEAWWLLGRKAGLAEAMSDQNEDYREILRADGQVLIPTVGELDRMRELLKALADEVERLRGYIETVEMNRIRDWQTGEAHDHETKEA